jgi:HEAT repeat protein
MSIRSSSDTVAEFARIREAPIRTEFLQIQLHPKLSPETAYRAFCSWLVTAICVACGGCGHDPIDALLTKLRDPDVEVRRAAMRSLVEQPVNDNRVIEEITKNVSDKNVELRYESEDALGKLGPAAKSSVPLLKLRFQDVDKNVRLRAAFSVEKIDLSDRSFEPVLTAAMREGDGRTLLEVGALGPRAAWAVPVLSALLSHESFKVRSLAAKALGSIGPAAISAKANLEALRRDNNPTVQKAASDALTRIGAAAVAREAAK